jgi:predicted nucleic acid-binding protein
LFKDDFRENYVDVIIDTSALVAVIVGEPERDKIIRITTGKTLIGPGSIPWEVGNAFSSMFKQKRLTLKEAQNGLTIFQSIPIRYVEVDFNKVLKLSRNTKLYAYDAYFLDCAIRHKAPLVTLDRHLKTAAQNNRIEILEI